MIMFLKMNSKSLILKETEGLNLNLRCANPFKGHHKIAIKVVDIFGNDTMKIIEVTV
jgi:hypothetical protein